jgi:hypothetical protein
MNATVVVNLITNLRLVADRGIEDGKERLAFSAILPVRSVARPVVSSCHFVPNGDMTVA